MYRPTSSMSPMVSMATTSSAASSSLMTMPSTSSHCHYDSLCSTSTSGHRLFHAFDNRLDHNFDTKSDNQLIGVPNDYNYNTEEQHEFCPKMKSFRPKSHDIKRKHIFKDIAGMSSANKWLIEL